jgi:flagellin
MIIQHNIMALNAHRQLSANNTSLQKNIEKLSSGFKINRAGDDASGLAISEKMRAQIAGLEVAQNNAQDGISLIQTAEGALTEVHSMLNRMVELAEKSANGTIQDDVDRDAIQKEVDDLLLEIDRISQATNFNGIELLGGIVKGEDIVADIATEGVSGQEAVVTLAFDPTGIAESKTFEIGGFSHVFTAGQGIDDLLNAINGGSLGSTWNVTHAAGFLTFTQKSAAAFNDPTSLDATYGGNDITASLSTKGISSQEAEVTVSLDDSKIEAGSTFKIGGFSYEFAEGESVDDLLTAIEESSLGSSWDVAFASGVLTFTQKTAEAFDDPTSFNAIFGSKEDFNLTLQIGDTNESYQQVTVSIQDLSSTGLGINGLRVDSQSAAADSIADIKAAINVVSTNRANLGGLQNRLEQTMFSPRPHRQCLHRQTLSHRASYSCYSRSNRSQKEASIQKPESRLRDGDFPVSLEPEVINEALLQFLSRILPITYRATK